jgi:hypothetical protein
MIHILITLAIIIQVKCQNKILLIINVLFKNNQLFKESYNKVDSSNK